MPRSCPSSPAWFRLPIVFAALAIALPASAGLLGISGDSVLYDINTSNGTPTNPRTVGNKVLMIAMSPSGTLYGVSQGTPTDVPAGGMLYTIDVTFGTPTLVDTLDQYLFVEGDIAVDPTTSILYGVDGQGILYTISTVTAQVTTVGTVSTNNIDLSAMTFDAAGNLYMVDSFGPTLLRVNKTNGSIISSLPLDPINQEVGGLVFSPGGTLFHAAGTTSKLYTVNTITGNCPTLGPIPATYGIWGLTWQGEPTSIEPSTWSRIKNGRP